MWIRNGKKQDLKAGECWQNSNFTAQARSRSNKQKQTEIWNKNDGFKPGSRLDQDNGGKKHFRVAIN